MIEEQVKKQINAIGHQNDSWHESGEMMLEEGKNLQHGFELNINKISRGRYKSEWQKDLLENIKLLYHSREVVIKTFNNYYSIAFEAKYKTIHGKRIPSMSSRAACKKVWDHSNLKILSPKQKLQRLPITLAQVKGGYLSEILLNEIRKIINFLCRPNEITKNEYNNIMNSIKA